MRIALCSYSQKEKETALLMKLGKVDRFDNGVFCTYAMQRDGPYDAVVVICLLYTSEELPIALRNGKQLRETYRQYVFSGMGRIVCE